MHHVKETGFSLSRVEVIIYDEADRLFEMGFEDDIKMIADQMPKNRQSLLFSATIPKSLADFTISGIREYKMIKLDHEFKLSDQLKLNFFITRSADKPASLLYLLKELIPTDDSVILFAATKYHVEYLYDLCTKAKISCSYIFGNKMDQVAR